MLQLLLVFLSLSALSLPELRPIKSDRPLFEIGVIGGSGYLPHYPASNEGQIRYLAAPMFKYRGLRLRSDEEDSLKARLFDDPHYGFDLGASGGFSLESDRNEARKGMKDLDWLGEIGPRFYSFLIKKEEYWLRFFLPARAAFSTDLSQVTYQGMVFAPNLNFRYFFKGNMFNSLILSFTRSYTTDEYQDFYYDVDPKFAAAERPAYEAVSGYHGSSLSMVYLHEVENKGYYVGAVVNSYKGAANSGSPLHKEDYTYSAFLAFSYTLYESNARGYQ